MAVKKALVIQHVEHEGLGSLYKQLTSKGFIIEYTRLYMKESVPEDINPYAVIIIMGGPMGANDEDLYPYIPSVLGLLEQAMHAGKPTLGICLGAQLMARAAGGRVFEGDTKEIGWYGLTLNEAGLHDPVLKGLPEDMTVFQWHGDTFSVPDGAILLASSERFESQIVRLWETGYAFQLHFEVMEVMVNEWLEINSTEIKGLDQLIDPNYIRAETPKHVEELRTYADLVFSNFLNLVEN